jgi:hypothetical protein
MPRSPPPLNDRHAEDGKVSPFPRSRTRPRPLWPSGWAATPPITGPSRPACTSATTASSWRIGLHWGFGLYLASSGKYENQILPTGLPTGTPKKPSTAPATSTSATDPDRLTGRTTKP